MTTELLERKRFQCSESNCACFLVVLMKSTESLFRSKRSQIIGVFSVISRECCIFFLILSVKKSYNEISIGNESPRFGKGDCLGKRRIAKLSG